VDGQDSLESRFFVLYGNFVERFFHGRNAVRTDFFDLLIDGGQPGFSRFHAPCQTSPSIFLDKVRQKYQMRTRQVTI
jgi:hypothetical protein